MAEGADNPLRILPPHVPRAHPGATLSLRNARPGQTLQLLAIRLPSSERERLYEQGFIESRYVTVLHNDHRGRILLQLDGELFLLGRRETPRIQVREIHYR